MVHCFFCSGKHTDESAWSSLDCAFSLISSKSVQKLCFKWKWDSQKLFLAFPVENGISIKWESGPPHAAFCSKWESRLLFYNKNNEKQQEYELKTLTNCSISVFSNIYATNCCFAVNSTSKKFCKLRILVKFEHLCGRLFFFAVENTRMRAHEVH